jgi:carbonic anhydrase/acetyltransferase-like protein (isoleucine patch superfamily)
MLHACKIGDNSLIGIGAIVLNGAEVSEGAIVGAGAIVTPRTKIPPFTMALGVPATTVYHGFRCTSEGSAQSF